VNRCPMKLFVVWSCCRFGFWQSLNLKKKVWIY